MFLLGLGFNPVSRLFGSFASPAGHYVGRGQHSASGLGHSSHEHSTYVGIHIHRQRGQCEGLSEEWLQVDRLI